MNIKILKIRISLTFCIMLISAFWAINISAQSGTATITGTVADAQGAIVPGATVNLTNPSTGFTRSVVTNQAGVYNFPSIPTGRYTIEVTAANFKKSVKTNVEASVDKTIEVNIPLEPGEISAVVDVNASNESITSPSDATIGNNFEPRQITQLPTDLRRVTDLLSLQPGVTREGYVNGGRSDQANITLDGIDVNDQQTGEAFSSVLRVTTEAVEEFRITTTNPNANQGRSSGAQISLVTKGGSNNFHGVGFGFYRPTAFSANSFFNNLAVDPVTGKSVPRPSLARKVFGGAIGGPIKKDRAFFFYSYEGQKQKQDISVVRTVPLANLGQGQLNFLGGLPGEVICTSSGNPAGCIPAHPITLSTTQLNAIFPGVGINPAAVAVFADAARRYPANDTSVGDSVNVGGFRFNSPTSVSENTHIARFDFNINDKQSVFARGTYQFDNAIGTSYFPDTPSTTVWDHPYGFVVGHNWTISSDKVNNFRYGLTRQAFTNAGDSNDNAISFRFVFQPRFFARNLSRVTPVQNITDDFTFIKGNHTVQFGGNIRIIRNKRIGLANSYDNAVANPSFYASSGRVLDRPVTAAGYTIGSGQRTTVQNALSALIGRFSQYTGQYNYDLDGNILSAGTPNERNFATEEYDAYVQDIWKPFRSLTLTLGLRYGLSRPVYEKNGYQVAPTVPLGDFFDKRVQGAANGTPYNALINFDFAGPTYNKQGFYKLDKNNFQPRIAAAWSPSFKNSFLKTLFGGEGQSTIRGGFAVTNDHFGEQLAVSFDALSTLGFTTKSTISANTYNTSSNPAPRFTGFGQPIRTLPGVAAQNRFTTNVTPECLNGTEDCEQRIESSLDSTLVTPVNYSWNLSYGRQLPKGMYVEVSYVGRAARNLLATRDINALNNLVDKKSGVDWYTAAGLLADLRDKNTPVSSVGAIPYFQNIFPSLGPNLAAYLGDPDFANLTPTQAAYYLVARSGYDILDWTYVQLLIDDQGIAPNLFYHPQYAAFSAFSTVAKSNYHGGSISVRQRLGESLSYDFNYTLSQSKDNASGLQTSGSYGSAFILNSIRPDDNYAFSDFDVRHVINANFIFQIPFGKNRKFFSNLNSVADAFLGGWQLSGIYRWNSGLPISSPSDAAQWATNWNVQSNGTTTSPLTAKVNRNTQNLFSDPAAAYASFRNARAGETGQRNNFRLPGYSALDLGLSKSFKMPYNENHKLQVRWEVFNVANTQSFLADNLTRSTFGLEQDPQLNPAASNFGKIFTDIQGAPRRMQFGLRYSF